MSDYLLSTEDAADYIGIPAATLSTWRSRPPRTGTPPPFVRVGGSAKYRRSDLDAWMASLPPENAS